MIYRYLRISCRYAKRILYDSICNRADAAKSSSYNHYTCLPLESLVEMTGVNINFVDARGSGPIIRADNGYIVWSDL